MSGNNRRLIITERAALDYEDIATFSTSEWGQEQALTYVDALERGFLSISSSASHRNTKGRFG